MTNYLKYNLFKNGQPAQQSFSRSLKTSNPPALINLLEQDALAVIFPNFLVKGSR